MSVIEKISSHINCKIRICKDDVKYNKKKIKELDRYREDLIESEKELATYREILKGIGGEEEGD